MDLAYKQAYAMNQRARTKLVETCLETGSIAETARRWHTSRSGRERTMRTGPQGPRTLGSFSPLSHPDPSGDRGQGGASS